MPLLPKEKTRNSSGKLITYSLFADYGINEYNFFTLSREDKEGLVSFPKLYLQYCIEDPTEYTFAMEVFGNWSYWETLLQGSEVRKEVEILRKERDMAIKSKAVTSLIKEVEENGKSAFSAAKLLLDRGYIDKDVLASKVKNSKEADEKTKAEVKDLATIKERLQLHTGGKK